MCRSSISARGLPNTMDSSFMLQCSSTMDIVVVELAVLCYFPSPDLFTQIVTITWFFTFRYQYHWKQQRPSFDRFSSRPISEIPSCLQQFTFSPPFSPLNFQSGFSRMFSSCCWKRIPTKHNVGGGGSIRTWKIYPWKQLAVPIFPKFAV